MTKKKPEEPPWRPAKPGELNHALVDRWTFIHLSAGMAMAGLGVSPLGMLFVAVAWETLVEPRLKRRFPEAFLPATQDSFQNSIGDVAANVVGNMLGHRLLAGLKKRR